LPGKNQDVSVRKKMKRIKAITYGILILVWIFLITATTGAYAGSTQSNVSGSNTAIEGNYTGGSTTYESGSSSSTTSTTSSTSNIRSAPPTSSAPGMNTSNNCAMALSGGVQTFSIGVSGGKHVIDKTCELIVLSRTLNSFGMKVAAISLLCQDERIFKAMAVSGTPCPALDDNMVSKIGKDAKKLLAEKYNYEMPTYEKWVEMEKKRIKAEKKKIILPKKKPIKMENPPK
tara:strand:- start:1762 stop:2454 length:693 start_codon:yes stop_codon:yes gene_type:complete